MTSTTMTVYDPEGNAFEMELASRFDDDETWCDFCEETVTDGWFNDEGAALFVLCDSCAQASATTEGR